MSLIEAVTQAITQVLAWVGTVIGSLIDTGGALSPLLPLFAIGIAISAILLGKLFVPSLKRVNSVKLSSETIPSQAYL